MWFLPCFIILKNLFLLFKLKFLQDDNKTEIELTVANDKDKNEKDSKKTKKEVKEKDSNKKKYDKKSGNNLYL